MKSIKKPLGVALLSLLFSAQAFGGVMLGGFVGDTPPPPDNPQQQSTVVSPDSTTNGESASVDPVASLVLSFLQALGAI
jgi:hypothetical protein